MNYDEFLLSRAQLANAGGFEPINLPSHLFDFQAHLVEWAVRQGRAAIFADCGLGKTPMALAWAEQVHRHIGKPVLFLTPLAVGFQIVTEAEKFGHDAALSRNGKLSASITVTNYEQLDKFDWADFGGVVCDESSILKSFDGSTKAAITEFMRRIQYRLLATATAAPNDYTELGTSSEALGGLGYMDMLTRFFIDKDRKQSSRGGRVMRWEMGKGNPARGSGQWRLKGPAEIPFWRWVSTWARAMRRPSDYGFDDGRFILPELVQRTHVVEPNRPADGVLFDMPASGLAEEREETRRTLVERCEMAARVVEPHPVSLLWCNLNDEGDLLERLVPNAIQVKGSDPAEFKEAATEWFTGRRCICNDPLFARKLAAWHGNRNTLPLAASVTAPTLPNGNGERLKAGPASRTASTCSSTTATTASAGSAPKNSARNGVQPGASGTPTTRSSANGRRQPLAPPTLNGSARTESVASTESPLTSTTRCSPHSNTVAPFAERDSEAVPGDDSQSITATEPASSEGCSAAPAILPSVSSGTTPNSSMLRLCICGHTSGQRRLISKTRIYGWGLNFQHCAHMTYFPTHSYESFYQAVRRCWRFGQTEPVMVDVITTPGGLDVLANLQRKSDQADQMFSALVAHMNNALRVETLRDEMEVRLPSWVS